MEEKVEKVDVVEEAPQEKKGPVTRRLVIVTDGNKVNVTINEMSNLELLAALNIVRDAVIQRMES